MLLCPKHITSVFRLYIFQNLCQILNQIQCQFKSCFDFSPLKNSSELLTGNELKQLSKLVTSVVLSSPEQSGHNKELTKKFRDPFTLELKKLQHNKLFWILESYFVE